MQVSINPKRPKLFLERHKNIHLYYLPPYSPEYNPVEIVWRWIKPKVYGSSSLGGIDQLVSRFRKYIWNYNNKKLVKPLKLRLKTYEKLL